MSVRLPAYCVCAAGSEGAAKPYSYGGSMAAVVSTHN